MFRKNTLLLGLLLCCGLSANGQDSLRWLREVTLPAGHVYRVDAFENFYVAQGANLQKLNKEGLVQAQYSQPLLGPIADVDLLNALEPLLFFEEVNTLVLLDNRLNESRQVHLNNLGFIDPTLVGYTDQEHVWIYDQQQDKVLRWSTATAKIDGETLNLTQILGSENQPEALFTNFNRFTLKIEEQGLWFFDALGSYSHQLNIPSGGLMALTAQHFYVATNGQLLIYPQDDYRRMPLRLKLPTGQGALHLAVVKDRLYLFFPGKVAIYQLPAGLSRW